jgi:hypothetical protein
VEDNDENEREHERVNDADGSEEAEEEDAARPAVLGPANWAACERCAAATRMLCARKGPAHSKRLPRGAARRRATAAMNTADDGNASSDSGSGSSSSSSGHGLPPGSAGVSPTSVVRAVCCTLRVLRPTPQRFAAACAV